MLGGGTQKLRVRGAVASAAKSFVSFRMPTADNLVPIRLDLDLEGRKLKDAFTWNPEDPDSDVMPFAKRMVKDLNLPAVFMAYISQSIQSQLTEFRSYEGQDMSTEEKVQIIKDVNDFKSDPEGFARGLCKDLELDDPEVAPAVAVSIREQLYEIAKQNLATGRETRISKKVRRDKGAVEYFQPSAQATTALNLMKRPNSKTSIVRRRNEWDMFEPVVEILTDKEAEALHAREERNSRLKKRQEEKDDAYASRYVRV